LRICSRLEGSVIPFANIPNAQFNALWGFK
jgi:hypothetical protein